MEITIRTILLAAAVVLFVLALILDANWPDLVALGLAAFAGAFVVEGLGVDRRVGGSR